MKLQYLKPLTMKLLLTATNWKLSNVIAKTQKTMQNLSLMTQHCMIWNELWVVLDVTKLLMLMLNSFTRRFV